MAIKRKAVTRDSPVADEVVLSDGSDGGSDIELNGLDDILSLSGDDSVSDLEEDEIDFEDESTDFTEDEGETKDPLASEANGVGLSALESRSVPMSVVKDANGNDRYIYEEIDAVYDSDDSALEAKNTIGDIPLSFYDSYPHIGYDVHGKKIVRPAKGEALDQLLDSIEIPEGWTGLTDPATGKPLELSKDELDILKRIQQNEIPEEQYDPYAPTVEYFTSKLETMPLSAAPEPKRRFVPSKHEAKRVMKIVKAIREGRIQPYKPPTEEDEEEAENFFDLWADEAPRPDHPMNMPAPKLPPPSHDQSYHPPPEYLPDQDEKKAWDEADPEDREKDYLPTDHTSLRKVPGYEQFVKERFERSLDLYLAPRVRRAKLDIDPESLLPKLPSPEDLRPFPSACAIVFKWHTGRVRSAHIDPSGLYLATGADDGVVRVAELSTGNQVWSSRLSKDEAVDAVRWRPSKEGLILAAGCGDAVYLIVPTFVDEEVEVRSKELLDAGWGYAAQDGTNPANKRETGAQWSRPGANFEERGVLIKIALRAAVKTLAWHRRGEYFTSISPKGQSTAIAIHALSKHLTQLPFRRLKGLPQTAQFHPSKPWFSIATQRMVRSYDLQKQTLERIEQPGARWISSIDYHPGGNNLIIGSYDRRLLWHDLELENKPYKTLRYHQKAIRAVKYHQGALPLFADASDDGTLQIFHGKVVSDAMENATIVPLKVLRGHQIQHNLGVLDIDWHPVHPWLVSAGADGTCRSWT